MACYLRGGVKSWQIIMSGLRMDFVVICLSSDKCYKCLPNASVDYRIKCVIKVHGHYIAFYNRPKFRFNQLLNGIKDSSCDCYYIKYPSQFIEFLLVELIFLLFVTECSQYLFKIQIVGIDFEAKFAHHNLQFILELVIYGG